ncbi:MAG: Ig-like domain-containing protein [bacterium]|nr:Ig-like domain-containing protein [bacterium]
MNKIHKKLVESWGWYARYHQHEHHQKYLWVVLGMFSLMIVSVFLAVTIKDWVLFDFNNRSSAAGIVYSTPQWQSTNELWPHNLIGPSYQILEVNLSYNTPKKLLSLINISRKRGYAPLLEPIGKGFQFQALDKDQNVIQSLEFVIPNTVEGVPPPLTGEKKEYTRIVLPQTNFSLTLPWHAQTSVIRILNPDGNTILTQSTVNIPIINNKSNFRSKWGNDFFRSKKNNSSSSFLNSITSSALAQVNNGVLDITFVGDNYTVDQLPLFHNDVDRFISHFLTYEPFKSRASQIFFHYVDNTDDLYCRHDIGESQIITCDGFLATQAVNNAGAPYDKVIIIVNDSIYGGSTGELGGTVSVAYNGTKGPAVFVHEFGHLLGRLSDEYNAAGGDGNLYNTVNNNCYSGLPPASAWSSYVALNDYAEGCWYSNYYRSSPQSIMISTNAWYFNVISQNLLNIKIDYFAGAFVDTLLPVSSITSPADGAIVSGTVTITVSLSDDNGIARAALWKDGVLFQTSYVAPFDFSWSTTQENDGLHTLQVKAYDVNNNEGASPVITVTVDNTPPTAPTGLTASAPSSSTVNLSWTASIDSVGVSGYKIYRNSIQIATTSATTYSDATVTAETTYSYTVRAYDVAGNTSVASNTATVTTPQPPLPPVDTIPPAVSVTNPANGSTVPRNNTVTITASASDDKGVTKVEFYVNSLLHCTDIASPYSCAWNVPGAKNRTYKIQAKAYDAAGNIKLSSIISVTAK